MRIWHSWRQLDWTERSILLLAFASLPFIVFSIRILGYRRTQGALGRLSPAPAAVAYEADFSQLRRYGDAVNTAANHSLVRANCLPRSLCFWWMLRYLRCDSVIRFGVTKQQQHLYAHAWVEYDGKPLNDQPDVKDRFLPLDPMKAVRMELDA